MEMLFKRMEENNVSFVILNCSNRWLGIALVNFSPLTASNYLHFLTILLVFIVLLSEREKAFNCSELLI